MNEVIEIALADAESKGLSLESLVLIGFNDVKLIVESLERFKNVYAYSESTVLMNMFIRMMRQHRSLHPSYKNDLARLSAVDIVMMNDFKDISAFDVSKSKYVCFMNSRM
jgi:hypothetical protein